MPKFDELERFEKFVSKISSVKKLNYVGNCLECLIGKGHDPMLVEEKQRLVLQRKELIC